MVRLCLLFAICVDGLIRFCGDVNHDGRLHAKQQCEGWRVRGLVCASVMTRLNGVLLLQKLLGNLLGQLDHIVRFTGLRNRQQAWSICHINVGTTADSMRRTATLRSIPRPESRMSLWFFSNASCTTFSVLRHEWLLASGRVSENLGVDAVAECRISILSGCRVIIPSPLGKI